MTQTLEALSRRTESMEGIRSVVHTMKSLSVINAAPFDNAARAIEAYHGTVLEGLHAYLSQSGPVSAPRIGNAEQVVVVFGSDHGLCGNYNEVLAAHVAGHLRETKGAARILCVGAQMQAALIDEGLEVPTALLPPASADGIGRLANLLTQQLDALRQAGAQRELAVTLAFFARHEGSGQAPTIKRLLPLDPALISELRSKPWASRSLPIIAMKRADLFATLIRGHLFSSLFRASAEALVTENAARLAMMQQAEQSVDDQLDELKSQMRNVRQSEITTELLDVIIGFEALKKARKPRSGSEFD